LQTDTAEYHGGYKGHILSGFLNKHQSGNMYLTENYLIFAKTDKDPSKKLEIMIPLRSVLLDRALEERERQKQIK